MSFFRKGTSQSKLLKRLVRWSVQQIRVDSEDQKLLIGKMLVESVKVKKNISSLQDVEFKIFSQFGDDGIIQWLINNIEISADLFIEFGVEDYRESNTRFLLMNNNWSGFVMDGSADNVRSIIGSEYYWRHEIYAKGVFIDKDNINDIIRGFGISGELGLLHIDIDGNDYWIWKEIKGISPEIVILEYNSIFGIDRSITVPYDKNFNRTASHYSNLYFGASLKALYELSVEKGYAFVGCNSAGNNAYFVKRERLNSVVKEVSLEEGYVVSKFRESRDKDFNLSYLSGGDRLGLLKGMKVFNTLTDQLELL